MRKQVKPLVSVIMPVYNAGSFLSEAIESIILQTYKNWELIIIDDASTDGSWKVIRSYAKRFPKRIKAVKLQKNINRGGDAAGNIAALYTNGDFIARMDADDISAPNRLEKQINYMLLHSDCAVLGSNAFVLNREGVVVGNKIVPSNYHKIYKEYFVFHPIIHPTAMIRKSLLDNPKRIYRLDYNANNDYLTFFEMIAKGKRFANLEDKLLYYRIHGENDSLINVKSRFINSLKIRARAVFEFGYKPSMLNVLKLGVQSLAVLIIPEVLIVPIYLWIRGIRKPEFIFTPGFVRLKRALVAPSR